MIKVLIIEANVVVRKFLSDAVNNTQIAEVSHASPNGDIAFMWLEQNKVDMILLSAEIDKINTTDILRNIQDRFDTKVIVVNTCNEDAFKIFNDSMNIGALDFVDIHTMKFDSSGVGAISEKLKAVLKTTSLDKTNKIVIPKTTEKDIETIRRRAPKWACADIVLIASSTGGPVALEKVFGKLPKGFSKPILVVQHIPQGFTSGLAKTIDKLSGVNVIVGENGAEIVEGKAIIAPGGLHMVVSQNKVGTKKIQLIDSDYVNGVKPSADVLFKSIAEAYEGKNILAVVLTGMGRDGAEGIKELKRKSNCYCITQTVASCVAYGMPKAVQDLGLSDKEVDIEFMAGEIYKIAGGA